MRRFPDHAEGLGAPYWSSIQVAIEERLNAGISGAISPTSLAPLGLTRRLPGRLTLRSSVRSGLFVPLRYVPAGSGTDQA